MERYLIWHNGTAFFTRWYDYENNYMAGMVAFDLMKGLFTTDGTNWQDIPEDHL